MAHIKAEFTITREGRPDKRVILDSSRKRTSFTNFLGLTSAPINSSKDLRTEDKLVLTLLRRITTEIVLMHIRTFLENPVVERFDQMYIVGGESIRMAHLFLFLQDYMQKSFGDNVHLNVLDAEAFGPLVRQAQEQKSTPTCPFADYWNQPPTPTVSSAPNSSKSVLTSQMPAPAPCSIPTGLSYAPPQTISPGPPLEENDMMSIEPQAQADSKSVSPFHPLATHTHTSTPLLPPQHTTVSPSPAAPLSPFPSPPATPTPTHTSTHTAQAHTTSSLTSLGTNDLTIQLGKRIAEMQIDLDAKSKELTSLSQTIHTQTQHITSLQADLTSQTQCLTSLQSERDTLTQTNHTQHSHIQTLTQQIEELQANLGQRMESHRVLETERNAFKMQYEEMKRQYDEMQRGMGVCVAQCLGAMGVGNNEMFAEKPMDKHMLKLIQGSAFAEHDPNAALIYPFYHDPRSAHNQSHLELFCRHIAGPAFHQAAHAHAWNTNPILFFSPHEHAPPHSQTHSHTPTMQEDCGWVQRAPKWVVGMYVETSDGITPLFRELVAYINSTPDVNTLILPAFLEMHEAASFEAWNALARQMANGLLIAHFALTRPTQIHLCSPDPCFLSLFLHKLTHKDETPPTPTHTHTSTPTPTSIPLPSPPPQSAQNTSGLTTDSMRAMFASMMAAMSESRKGSEMSSEASPDAMRSMMESMMAGAGEDSMMSSRRSRPRFRTAAPADTPTPTPTPTQTQTQTPTAPPPATHTLMDTQHTTHAPASAPRQPIGDENVFTVMSFNVLAQAYVTRSRYHYCPTEVLQVQTRHTALMNLIVSKQADIICLQELQRNLFEPLFTTLCRSYEAFYQEKPGRQDGCGIFFKRDRFRPIAQLNHILLPNNPKHLEMANYLTLEHQGSHVTHRLVVANTHLTGNPTALAEKKDQCISLLMHMEECVQGKENTSVLVCGDFNADPMSGLYEFITTGHLPANRREPDSVHTYSPTPLHQPSPLSSAYAQLGGEPQATFVTNQLRKTTDYLFYRNVVCVNVDRSECTEHLRPMPNVDHPSDHIPVMGTFRFV